MRRAGDNRRVDDVGRGISESLYRVHPGAVVQRVIEVPHNRWLTPLIARVETSAGTFVCKRLSPDRPQGATPWEAHWTARADDPRHWNYWRREACVYEEGLAAIWAPEGITAPPVVGITSTGESVDLWLQWVAGTPGEDWDLSDYELAARRLGAGQGRLALASRPERPFTSRRFLRDYSSEKPVAWGLLESDEAWGHPLVRRACPTGLREATTRLHASRERLYSIAERAPRTLCHLDFWTKNLIRRDDQICLLDWAMVGDGALGEDIGNLIPDAVFDHFVPAARLPELEGAVFEAYLDGLRSAGWSGDPQLVQLGMWASAVKYDWLTPALLESASASRHLAYGGTAEVDADHRFNERGVTLLRLTRWADLALDLADRVGL